MHKQEETSSPLLEQVLTHLTDGVAIIEADQGEPRIIFANRAAGALAGADGEDLVGQHPRALYAAFAAPSARDLDQAFSGDSIVERELSAMASGKEIWWLIRVVPLYIEQGLGRHFVLTARDVSQQKGDRTAKSRLEDQLFQSQKLESIGVLASGIAHDFNNILTGVVGSTELIKMTLPHPHPAHEDLDNIMQAAQRAAGLTRELLAYASTNKQPSEIINVNQMVTGILVILRSQMSRSIIVRKALMPDVPSVEADAVQVQQVMMNLCLNASDAMREQGGILSITTDKVDLDEEQCEACTYLHPEPGVYAVFEVTDTGSGMTPAQLDRIFSPFFTTKPHGRGLGLAAVRNIVKLHRGGIQVVSDPGHGTTIRIFLPASNKHAPLAPTAQTSGQGGTQTILFVDDEEVLRSLGQRALERFGYRVLLAADGIEAVRTFREHAKEIDLVILDLSMPRKGGEDAYQEMRNIRADLKVLLCCGYNEAIANSKIAGEDVVGFLPKPWGIDTLADTVQSALNK